MATNARCQLRVITAQSPIAIVSEMLMRDSSISPPISSLSICRHVNTLCFALGVEEADVVIDGALPMAPWDVARLGGLTGLFDLTEPGRRGP